MSRAALVVAMLLAAAAYAQAPPPAAVDTLKRIRETGMLLLGVREASVPFSFLDAQKQPQGYSVDLCLKVADAIKAELRVPRLEVKYVPVSPANRIPMTCAARRSSSPRGRRARR